ncbi:MAG: shikimate kinase [Oligoflexales bacterium]
MLSLVFLYQKRRKLLSPSLRITTAQQFRDSRKIEVFQILLLWQTKVTSVAGANMSYRENVIIIGMPGAGKSAVGRLLSSFLGHGYVDLDTWISRKEKQSPKELIEKRGLEAWRDLELSGLKRLKSTRNMVISVGGGAVHQMEIVELLQQMGTVVYLDCELPELVRRLSSVGEVKKRPLLADALDESGNIRKESLETLLRGLKVQRREWFERAAEVILPTDYASIDICAEWLHRILCDEKNKEGKANLWSHLKASY